MFSLPFVSCAHVFAPVHLIYGYFGFALCFTPFISILLVLSVVSFFHIVLLSQFCGNELARQNDLSYPFYFLRTNRFTSLSPDSTINTDFTSVVTLIMSQKQSIMRVSGDKLKHVSSLRVLCTAKARTAIVSTELLLSLPHDVLRDLYGTSSTNGDGIVKITDAPLQSDGNVISGALCGYHVLKKEFLFGEYEAGVFQEPLENVSWKNSVHARKIVMFIQDFFYEEALNVSNETSWFSKLKCLTTENGKRIKANLYQQVARWVVKNNCYLACNLTDEFIELARKETFILAMRIL